MGRGHNNHLIRDIHKNMYPTTRDLFIMEAIMALICYCHGYTEADIVADLKKNQGDSSILRQILEARRSNTCQCDVKHPEKR